MSNSSAAAAPAGVKAPAAVEREVIIEFSPEALQAPFLLRMGSMLIDYMVLLVIPIGALFYSRLFGEPLGIMSDRTLWLISVVLFLGNIILLPLASGRSLGKILTGLRIVRVDGGEAATPMILLRQTLGYMVTALTLGLGFLFCVFSSKGRALHDLLTGTVVVQGNKRVV